MADDSLSLGTAFDVSPCEEQLRQVNKIAVLGQVAAGIVHDFNHVLQVIRGYSELILQESGLNDASRENLLQIRRAVDRGASLTRQLLVFSRKEALEPVPLSLNSLIDELQGSLQRLLGESIEMRVILGSDVCPVKLDPGLFQQVVMNLAINARDAMPNGGSLTIKTAEVEVDEAHAKQQMGFQPGHYAIVDVTDTGSGIDPATKSHIFEPFFTTKEKDKGTGLGLANVIEILTRSGGSVAVDSEPGNGSSFKVFLPCLTCRTN